MLPETKEVSVASSQELNHLLKELRIGEYAAPIPHKNETVDLQASSSDSDGDSDTNPCTGTSPPSTEIINLVSSDDDEEEDEGLAIPGYVRKTINLIDSSSSSEDEEENTDDDEDWRQGTLVSSDDDAEEEEEEDESLAIPGSVRKAINLIDSSSSSEDEEEEEEEEDNDGNEEGAQPTSILPSLNAVLQRTTIDGHRSTIPPDPRRQIDTTTASSSSSTFRKPPFPQQHFTHTAFARSRTQLARDFYAKYNALIFNGILPADLDITWNKRLATTAGLTHYRRENGVDVLLPTPRYTARIELSCKVLDTAEKLERTLVHEMCHCAAWLVDHVAKPPHGPVFKAWATRAMRAAPHLDVSTCHQYEIFFSFQWQCDGCSQIYGRHSNSIDVGKKVCGVCKGRLSFLGRFDRNGTPAKRRQPTAFNIFVKENFAATMKARGPGTASSDVMKELTVKWKEQKAKEDVGVILFRDLTL